MPHQRNNFHNCSLVFLLQHGAAPTIVDNNVESCLIGDPWPSAHPPLPRVHLWRSSAP